MLTCVLCGARHDEAHTEHAMIGCNVRRFKAERFGVWRCPSCESIHASEPIEIAPYYVDYPYHKLRLDVLTRVPFRKLLGRLRRVGLHKEDRVLDYGCGSGVFLSFLKARGISAVDGYDQYSSSFGTLPSGSEHAYQLVVAQDVVEHAESPLAVLDELGRLTRPNGVVVIGTPDASGIRLEESELFLHTLHQPFHRHMFSRRALLAAAADRRWTLVRFWRSHFVNTFVPGINERFSTYYLRCAGDVLDAAFEPPRIFAALFHPRAIFWALFGALFPQGIEMMAAFRVPPSS
jgi:SAM-dependent methyltransferase